MFGQVQLQQALRQTELYAWRHVHLSRKWLLYCSSVFKVFFTSAVITLMSCVRLSRFISAFEGTLNSFRIHRPIVRGCHNHVMKFTLVKWCRRKTYIATLLAIIWRRNLEGYGSGLLRSCMAGEECQLTDWLRSFRFESSFMDFVGRKRVGLYS